MKTADPLAIDLLEVGREGADPLAIYLLEVEVHVYRGGEERREGGREGGRES